MNFGRYDRIVEHYAAQWPFVVPGYLPALNAMLDVVSVREQRPREILDLGCGPASATVAVAPACDTSGQVTLVDGSPAMLRAAQALVQAHVREAVCGDFTDPAVAERVFVAGRYDLCLCSFALHHIEDQRKRVTIDRLATSLAPGGLLVLADEVVADRPAGWDVVERVRARAIAAHLAAGRITPAFWEIETSLPPELHLPFLPARLDDLTSWMARAGLAVGCPLVVLGSALFVAVKP